MKMKCCSRSVLYSFLLIVPAMFHLTCNANDTPPVSPTRISEIKNVLIFGNSISFHVPYEEVGWYGNWGMAATAQELDYVHILSDSIRAYSADASIEIIPIVGFEQDFDKVNFALLDCLQVPDADLAIFQIGDNIDPDKAVSLNFGKYFDQLIDSLTNSQTRKIIVSSFKEMPEINAILKKTAAATGSEYVAIDHLSRSAANSAGETFSDPGVASHPGNKGMFEIAQAIWKALRD